MFTILEMLGKEHRQMNGGEQTGEQRRHKAASAHRLAYFDKEKGSLQCDEIGRLWKEDEGHNTCQKPW